MSSTQTLPAHAKPARTTRVGSSSVAITGTGAFKRFRVAAWAAGSALAVMASVGILWVHLLGNAVGAWYSLGWQVYGLLLMIYLLSVADLAIAARWYPVKAISVAIAGFIPALAFLAVNRIGAPSANAAAAGAPLDD